MPKSFSDVDYNTLFCLFKGEAGLRKSSAALSFPKPIYFFDFDQKMEALGLPINTWKINPSEVQWDTYKDWFSCEKKLEEFQVKCPYKTIVIDSLTACADAINRQSLSIKGTQKTKAGAEAQMKVAGIPVNSVDDYKAEESALSILISKLKDIKDFHKVNIIIIAHVIQKEMKTAEGKTHFARTIVTAGKGISQKIPSLCGEIYHFNLGRVFDADSPEIPYGLFTVHSGDDMARSSLPLPPIIKFGNDPLYDKWIKPAIEQMQKTVVKTVTEKPSFTNKT